MSLPESRKPSIGNPPATPSNSSPLNLGPINVRPTSNAGPGTFGGINIDTGPTTGQPENGLGWAGPKVSKTNISQKLREKNFMEAKWILIVIGIFQILGGLFLMFQSQSEVETLIRGGELDPAAGEATLWIVRAIYGVQVVAGLVFIGLGFNVKRSPTMTTGIGLGLYLAMIGGYALLDWTTLVQGIIFKVIFIMALFKAVKAAREYEDARRDELEEQREADFASR